MERIGAAVIGTGFIGPAHLEALRRIPWVDIRAIASNEPARARELADRLAVPTVYDDWRDVLRDASVQVIHNCTPNNLHFAINKTAIAAGKHVLSEKPLTLTSRESAELIALAKRAGIVHAVNYNYRFYPLIQHARQMVLAGETGDIRLVHGHYLQDWLFFDTDYNWRLDPGISGASRAVADIGSHWCDLVQFITGLRITAVCANLRTVYPKRKKPRETRVTFSGKAGGKDSSVSVSVETEDTGTIMFELSNGAAGSCVVSQVSAGRKNREWFEIDGSRCALSWDQEEPNQLWIGRRDGPNEVLIKDPSLLQPDARRYAHYPGGHPEGYPDGLKNLFLDFYTYLGNLEASRKEPPPFPTFEDGHWENLVVEAVLRSNKKRGWVRVQP
ncbi:MAG: Gfo/Idh/MocA family oxidoreductase [Bacteroidetes bacterium]|nr:Gfo/Idh/MocA family oxidoreductase [Bacteroidota bacterium]